MKAKSNELKLLFQKKRTYREFSDESVSIDVIKDCIEVALRAPSGANQQPWTFCIVQSDEMKSKIRHFSELEEQKFYSKDSLEDWHKALDHLEVDVSKPFLEEAPYLIVIFYHKSNIDGTNTYYASKSTGLASGMLISALHQVGLDSLTYTPQNMKFLLELLDRPDNEAPYLILAVGKGSENYKLPDITKKPTSETIKIY